ncbi:MAG TPA: MmgE/PrpD family protein [Ramlibacter sp.]|jgi:2-methylcitrate dehydratase PrpD|nr:MmgE/PrpD family protein [Ramlibacter sp.]
MNAAQALGRFASAVRVTELDGVVRERLAWIVADTVAAIAAGSAEPEMRALAAGHDSREVATLVGCGRGAAAETAALVNGTAGTFLEMDEGNRFARGHAAIHVVPAALAACEQAGADADTFLGAVIAGYEVCSRIAAASNLRGSMHPHGTWGTIGAAVACGRVAGLPPGHMQELIGISSSLMTATSKRTMLEGGLVRNVYAGLANRNGLLALQLLQAGFSAENDGLRSMFGAVLSESFDEQALLAGLPDEAGTGGASGWHVMQNYFKLHSCCRYNHGTLDALDQLDEAGQLPDVASVENVVVDTYGYAAELDDPAPRNTLAAKFSVPFAVASRLVHRSSGLSSFTWEAVRNPAVLALAARVTVREDPAMTRRLPQERPARVSIRLRDGSERTAQVTFNRGDDAAPYTSEQLTRKFLELTSRVWPLAHCQRVLDATLALGAGGTSMARWCDMLRHPPTQ